MGLAHSIASPDKLALLANTFCQPDGLKNGQAAALCTENPLRKAKCHSQLYALPDAAHL
ncbi:MAG: hypothetical protein Fur0021_33100 [Candidatus Promineifilaceae bacterium]